MAASSSLPLAVLFLLVLVASAVPATAAGGKYNGARMVIIRGPAATTRVAGADGASARSNEWQQHYRRLVEDEVAPELGGLLLGAGDDGIDYHVLFPSNTGCKSSSQCAAKGGGSYTRPCTFRAYCPHTPTAAGHARAVHG